MNADHSDYISLLKETAGDSEGEESFYPFGHPFRLSAGGKTGHFAEELSVPCQWTAQR